MKQTKFGIVMLLIIATMVLPAMACAEQNCDHVQPVDIDVNNKLNIDIDNTFKPVNNIDVDNTFSPTFSPDIDVDNFNTNKNYNANLNLNFNDVDNTNINKNTNNNVNNNYNTNNNNVDVDQSQKQNQNQIQLQLQEQEQKQQQQQTQANVQIVNIPIPKGADGGLLISNSNKAPTVTQLDVGTAQTFSRLVYPGEVLTYEVMAGNKISMRSSSDIALYTIGWFYEDALKVSSSDAIPVYNPFVHKFEWGLVVPVDKIDFWTTRATLSTGENAKFVVVDNRAPRNSYTHIEITITNVTATVV